MSHKRIVIVGPTASGKTFLRKKMEEKGFRFDVSYTTRPMRPGEVDGVHYKFIKSEVFDHMARYGGFYEQVEYNGYKYGTGMNEWESSDGFIMETDGIAKIDCKSRKKTFIIYLNPPTKIRKKRMKEERGWGDEEINKRIRTDLKKFKGFVDYDMVITDDNF